MKIYGIDIRIILIFLIIVSCASIALMIVTLVKSNKMLRRYEAFMRGSNAASLEDIFRKRLGQIDELVIRDMTHTEDIKNIYDNLGYTIQKIGIAKYDAFNEMGGKLSFCLTLLDRDNDGIILNSVHGPEGSYIYIKEVLGGKATTKLGEEEEISLHKAIYNE